VFNGFSEEEGNVRTIPEPQKLTCTVFLTLCEGPGYSGEYRSVRKSELIRVDFPSPDSPGRQKTEPESVGGSELEEVRFTPDLFSNPPFHARLRINVTQSPDVYQLHFLRTRSLCKHSLHVLDSRLFTVQEMAPFNPLFFF